MKRWTMGVLAIAGVAAMITTGCERGGNAGGADNEGDAGDTGSTSTERYEIGVMSVGTGYMLPVPTGMLTLKNSWNA
ncbi:MAG: hypothetical protein AAFY58_04550, partial [Planctomycetota bacterium]